MLITAVAFTETVLMSDHWPVCTQYIIRPLFVRSKIPDMFAMVPEATVILAKRSSSVCTTVSYTRSLDLTCLDFFHWGHMKQLVYETVV